MIVKCKDCGVEIEFLYEPVEAILEVKKDKKNKKEERAVYLTCENGHTNPYKLEI